MHARVMQGVKAVAGDLIVIQDLHVCIVDEHRDVMPCSTVVSDCCLGLGHRCAGQDSTCCSGKPWLERLLQLMAAQ